MREIYTMKNRLLLELSYSGESYEGWQIQPGRRTVQGTIEEVLCKINRNIPVSITGCGRTDTGVHAHQYFAHVDGLDFDVHQLKYKMNKMLPPDILIIGISPSSLHARFDAKRRTYKYFISKKKTPFNFRYRWVMERSLDIAQMNASCQYLLGEHDFASFAKGDSDVKTTRCEIFEIGWEEHDREYVFTVCANRFLRNMVRALVGTTVDIGLGKINSSEMPHILAQKSRSSASESVPAQGLFLWKIEY